MHASYLMAWARALPASARPGAYTCPGRVVIVTCTYSTCCKRAVIFLRLFIKPLLNFISEHQMIQTIPRDPRKLEKLI